METTTLDCGGALMARPPVWNTWETTLHALGLLELTNFIFMRQAELLDLKQPSSLDSKSLGGNHYELATMIE